MSLAAAALRILTVKSLDGATSAGAQVFDSAIDPRDLLGEHPQPTIVVYTDGGKVKPSGRDFYAGDQSVDLTIELFIARAMRIGGVDGQDEEYEIEYPETDAAFENLLRRLAYEITSVLMGSTSVWAELWRRFVVSFSGESEWDRGADAKNGRRFNFIRLTLRVDVLADPVRGAALVDGDAWSALFEAMASDAELADLAKDWRALVTTPTLAEWRSAQAALGLAHREISGIGLTPLLDHSASENAAPLTDVTLDPDAVSVDLLSAGDVT